MRESRDTGIWLKYEQGERVGEGTYGWVYHSRSRATGKRVALKQFKAGRDGDGLSHTAIREIMLLRELQHENIVRLDSVHIHRAEPCLWLAFDYADHDLYEMIRFHRDQAHNPRLNPHGLMPHHVVKSVMWQLLNGLSYLHQNWVIHRDLKPSNVLVTSGDEGPVGERGRVRIADFGLARVFQSPLRPLSDNGVVVTIWYRAPELLLGSRHYTRAVDVWAAGCIFAELCGLKPLFQGSERKPVAGVFPFQTDQLDRIFKVLGHPNPKAWPDLPHLVHWHENTDNIRIKKPEYPVAPAPPVNPSTADTRTVTSATPAPGSRQQAQAVGNSAAEGKGTSGSKAQGAGSDAVSNPCVDWAAKQLEYAVLETMRHALPPWLHGHIPPECRPPPEAFRLLAQMLDYNPMARITAEQALQHEYFTQYAPAPTANVFYAPNCKEPSVRYSPRIMGVPAAGGGGGGPDAAAPLNARAAAAPPSRAPAVGPPGRAGGVSAAAAAAAAAALGNPHGPRKRRAL